MATMATGGSAPKIPRPQGLVPAVAARRARPVPRVPPSRPPPKAEVEPAVLLVGASVSLKQALSIALSRHKVFVETSAIDGVIDAVVAAAPDVILLVGEAARDGGLAVLRKLQESPLSSVVPVVILHDDVGLDTRLRAFRHGAAAVIPRSASIDAIADQVARLAREIPERGSAAVGEVGEATLHEFVETLSKELRTGILTVGSGSEDEAVRLVLGGGQPIAQLIDEFVQRVRKHMLLAEPLRYEFDERAGGTIQLLETDGAPSEEPVDIAGLRILLADDDSARADGVAHELRTHGAIVAVTDLEPNDIRFGRLRQLDPSVLLIDQQHLSDRGYALVRRMRLDTRLRWASMLVVRWSEIWSDSAATPAIPRLAGALSQLGEPERAFIELTNAGDAFDTRIEVMGPGRILRAAAACDYVVRLSVHNPRVFLRTDVSEGLVVGVTGQTLGSAMKLIEGPAALSALLVLSSGRVRVERVEQAAAANIMGTIDVALNMADAEPSPIAPSVPAPPPSSPPAPDPFRASAPDDTARLLDELAEITVVEPPRFAMPPPPGLEEPAVELPRPQQATPPADLPAAANVIEPPAAGPEAPPMPAPKRRGGLIAALLGLIVLAGGASAWWFLGRPAAAPVVRAPPTLSPAPMAEPETSRPLESPEAQDAAPARLPLSPSDLSVAYLPVAKRARQPAPTCEDLTANTQLSEAKRHVALARNELMRGDVEAAHREYCLAVQADAENSGVLGELARVLLLARNDDEAAEPFARRALQNAKKPAHKVIMGDVLARRGNYAEALAVWLDAMKLTPDDVKGRANRARRDLRDGDTYFRVVQYAEAERAYLRAAVLNPRNGDAVAGVARSMLRQRFPEGAVAWAKHGRELAPENAQMRVILGDALNAADDQSGAKTEYNEALRLDPNNRDAQRRLRDRR